MNLNTELYLHMFNKSKIILQPEYKKESINSRSYFFNVDNNEEKQIFCINKLFLRAPEK